LPAFYQLWTRKGRDGLAHRAQDHGGVRGCSFLPGVTVPSGVQYAAVLHHGDARPRQAVPVEVVADEGVNLVERWAITAGGCSGSRQPCDEQGKCGQQGHSKTHADDPRIQQHSPASRFFPELFSGIPENGNPAEPCSVQDLTTLRLGRMKDEDTVRTMWVTTRYALVTASKLFGSRWVAIVVAMLCVQGALIWVMPLLTSLARWVLRHIGVSGINLYSIDVVVTSPLAALVLVGIVGVATVFVLAEITLFAVIAHLTLDDVPLTFANVLRRVGTTIRKAAS